MTNRCRECKHISPNVEEAGMGWCRRFPPQVYLIEATDDGHKSGSSFPYVSLDNGWCGEFQRRLAS